jgi:A/G-specific adenine glycosylase
VFRRRLLGWFARQQRDLPWRRDRDPYHIWVSEVMLQQTQAATVVPYFERFIAALPTLADLAAAPEQEVLRLWEGAGYYQRARNLHAAARRIVADHGGRFPRNPKQWRELPGIGRYLAGAILSQAFDQRLPIVEANSQRVLCRLHGRQEDPRKGPMRQWLWQTAKELLPRKQVGAFNQALMELGALVCTPRAPRCSSCPVARHCVARRKGLAEKIPPRRSPAQIERVEEAAVVIRRGRRVLLVQRPATGRWAGMWEFPHGPRQEGESAVAAAVRLAATLAGLHTWHPDEVLTIRHGVTRFRITMVCCQARLRRGSFRSSFYQQGRWLEPAELGNFPVSRPQRILAEHLGKGDWR